MATTGLYFVYVVLPRHWIRNIPNTPACLEYPEYSKHAVVHSYRFASVILHSVELVLEPWTIASSYLTFMTVSEGLNWHASTS